MEMILKKYFANINYFFFVFIIFLLLIEDLVNLTVTIKYIICFFLITTIGISHGAYDSHKGLIFLNKKIKFSKLLFYLTYISLVLFVFIIWYLNPKISLTIFLIISSFHFGKEDLEIYITRIFKFRSIIFFLKGSLIVLLPLYFKPEETNEIFNNILFSYSSNLIPDNFVKLFLPLNLLIQFFFYVYIFSKRRLLYKDFLIIFFEIVLTVIIFYFFSTITAFTLYFCFIHSLKNIIIISSQLNTNIYLGFKIFLLKSLPITILTFLILLASLYVFSNLETLEEVIQKIVFIGLASLTLPHIVLHYFIDR
jgi:Brp/Blh family beta-carotene 15,15'-monooxygenase